MSYTVPPEETRRRAKGTGGVEAASVAEGFSPGAVIAGSPIALLRRLAVRLAAEGDSDGVQFAAAVRMYEAGAADGLLLDAAFGLIPPPGGRSWWKIEQRER